MRTQIANQHGGGESPQGGKGNTEHDADNGVGPEVKTESHQERAEGS